MNVMIIKQSTKPYGRNKEFLVLIGRNHGQINSSYVIRTGSSSDMILPAGAAVFLIEKKKTKYKTSTTQYNNFSNEHFNMNDNLQISLTTNEPKKSVFCRSRSCSKIDAPVVLLYGTRVYRL
jgi:hypothetical protein